MSNVPPAGRTWARAEVKCSLQLPSGARSRDNTPHCWYFEIPSAHDTPERWRELVARITFDINTALRRREPDDLAWIDVESIKVYPVRPRQVLTAPETDPRSLPWVNIDRQRVWEPAVCYYVDDAGRYDVMSGHDFSELLLYRLLGLGEIAPEQCRGFLERYYAEAGPSAGQRFYEDREARLNNLTAVREFGGAPRKTPYEQPYSCCPDVSTAWPGGDFVNVGVPSEVFVAGYAGPDSGGAEASGGETASVFLEAIGESQIQVLVTVRDFAGLSVGGAKSLIDSVPAVVLSGVPRAEAERFMRELERVGATASLR
ncbi:MAG TPA: ribosomal protein L7/L12 [Pyrinomonadaceae bacterium]|nr:ribosomal protein L7/L12 [Pyrinomonadaceae bacterium]